MSPASCDVFKYSKSVIVHNSSSVSECYHPSSGGYCAALHGLRLFVVQGIQNGGRCIGCDTVYCWENSEECAEKGMTQNSKHNRFLSAPAGECRFLFFHTPIFPWRLQLSKCVCVCVCVFGRGMLEVFSFLAPSWPMRSWWSLSPLALRRWSLLSSAAHSQMRQECGWWWAMVCGHVSEPSPLHVSSDCYEHIQEKKRVLDRRDCYASLPVLQTWVRANEAECITRG